MDLGLQRSFGTPWKRKLFGMIHLHNSSSSLLATNGNLSFQACILLPPLPDDRAILPSMPQTGMYRQLLRPACVPCAGFFNAHLSMVAAVVPSTVIFKSYCCPTTPRATVSHQFTAACPASSGLPAQGIGTPQAPFRVSWQPGPSCCSQGCLPANLYSRLYSTR